MLMIRVLVGDDVCFCFGVLGVGRIDHPAMRAPLLGGELKPTHSYMIGRDDSPPKIPLLGGVVNF